MRWLLVAAVLSSTAPVAAEDTLVVVVAADDLARHAASARRGAAIALGADHAGDRSLDGSCDPSESGCIAGLASGSERVLVVRIVWQRGPCVPMRDEDGALVGHRVLRVESLRLELYDAAGVLLERGERMLATDADVAHEAQLAVSELLSP